MAIPEAQLELLYEITKAITDSLDLRKSLSDVLEKLNEKMGMMRATITLVDPTTETIRIEHAHGLSEEAKRKGLYKIGEGITGTVVKSGKPEIVPRMDQDSRFLNKTGSRTDMHRDRLSFICVPIKLSGGIIGTLSVDTPYKGPDVLAGNVRLLNIVASIIAQAVQLAHSVEEERNRLIDENTQLKHQLQERYHIEGIVGNSSKVQEVLELVRQVAPSNSTVLIRGETGTGKELIAQAIHYNSARAQLAFVKINCAALPETLLESELFGYEKGAFTGAVRSRKGRFSQAHRGTIFLDEIGDLPQSIQAKLLRVLQFKEFEPLGTNETVKVDVRILAATSKDLEAEVKKDRFRLDLYYRINVFPIFLPPLRERKGDIIMLADYFLEKYNIENAKKIGRISTPAIDMLTSYHWPGNVRELESCIERAVLVCQDTAIRAEHLPPSLQTALEPGRSAGTTLIGSVENLEREMILETLKSTHGHQGQAAKQLGITLRILGYKIQKYNIDPKIYASKGITVNSA
ncbi:MAG: sigma 54-interacting transcriptional regulator [Phycisphaerae bacterium]